MTLKIGIIGAGHMGYLHFLSCLKMGKEYNLYVAEKSKRIQKKISSYNISIYDDYTDLVDNTDIDCVIISLPNFLKKECIKYVSKNNIDIFIDKPIARNLDETKEIEKIIKKDGTRIMVGTNYRYHPNIIDLKQRLENGVIGDIKIASYELIMNGPLSHPRHPRQIADWYINPELSGGGAILDLAYHLIDLNQWFFGSSKLRYCTYDNLMNLPVEDSSTIITESEDGTLRSVFNVGWFSKVIFPEFNFRVLLHGSNGYLSSEKLAPNNLYFHAIKESISNFVKKITFQEIDYLSYTYYYKSFYQIIKEFLNCVKTGEEFPVSFEDQLAVMELINKAYKKGKKN
jgi:predicted dehydrogenase